MPDAGQAGQAGQAGRPAGRQAGRSWAVWAIGFLVAHIAHDCVRAAWMIKHRQSRQSRQHVFSRCLNAALRPSTLAPAYIPLIYKVVRSNDNIAHNSRGSSIHADPQALCKLPIRDNWPNLFDYFANKKLAM
tara:strand:- start:356 stop:751 length:396 start_codon:yes stop_codon:yes gene_type:complete